MTTLIKNCTLIDGSGKPRTISDVAIGGNKILATATSLPQTGIDTIINANGKVLAPGFIDAHSHSDISILAAPEATGKISQGITTDIIGNCGLSVFPVSDINRDHLSALYSNYGVDITWSTLNEYSAELNKRQPAINIATLCGHNSLRAATIGYENPTISTEYLNQMRSQLSDTLQSGAKGLSTGFLYTPGKFAANSEVEELLSILRTHGGVYATHIRSEGDQLLQSIDEAVQLSKAACISKLHISHLKASQERNWHKLDSAVDIIEKASDKTLSITADRYPYTESMTQLSIILPPPYDSMPDAQIERELQDETKYNELVKAMTQYDVKRWKNIRLVSTGYAPLDKHIGKTFDDIATITNVSPHILCSQAVRGNSAGTMAAFSGMCPENLNTILKTEFVCCGSDESARPDNYTIGRSHPRGFGSMPRFINMQQSLGIPLEESIRRITSLPTSIFGLTSRGLIAPGYYADLVLFDPYRLQDTADFTNPHSLSSGIEKVWVNGQLSFEGEEVSSNRSGRMI